MPNCRDTKTEFEEACGGDKLKKLIFTPLYPSENGNVWKILMSFDCNGNVHLPDAHNQDNWWGFVTKYKNENGECRTISDIHAEFGVQLIDYVYGKTK